MWPLICGKRNAIIPIWFNSMKTNFTWTAKKIPKNPKYIGIRMAQNPQNQRPAFGKSHNQLLKEIIGFHIHFEVFSWTFPQFSRRGFCRLSPLNLGITIVFYELKTNKKYHYFLIYESIWKWLEVGYTMTKVHSF